MPTDNSSALVPEPARPFINQDLVASMTIKTNGHPKSRRICKE